MSCCPFELEYIIKVLAQTTPTLLMGIRQNFACLAYRYKCTV
jgi:hypothetical protein